MSKIPRNNSLYSPINQLDSNFRKSLEKYRRSTSKFQEQMNNIYEQAFQARGLQREKKGRIMNRHTFDRFRDNHRTYEKDVIHYHGQKYVKESKGGKTEVQRTNREQEQRSKQTHNLKQDKGKFVRSNIIQRKGLCKRKPNKLEIQIQDFEKQKEETEEFEKHEQSSRILGVQEQRQPTSTQNILRNLLRVKEEFEGIEWHKQPNRKARWQEKKQQTVSKQQKIQDILHFKEEIDDLLIDQQANNCYKAEEDRQLISNPKLKQAYQHLKQNSKKRAENQESNRKARFQNYVMWSPSEKLKKNMLDMQEQIKELKRNQQSDRKARMKNSIARNNQSNSIEELNIKLQDLKNQIGRYAIQSNQRQYNAHSKPKNNQQQNDFRRFIATQAKQLEQNLKKLTSSEKKKRLRNNDLFS